MNIKQISFNNINQVLAHQLGSVFQPTYSEEGSFHYRRNPLGTVLLYVIDRKVLCSESLKVILPWLLS